jgi:hypothetical protein
MNVFRNIQWKCSFYKMNAFLKLYWCFGTVLSRVVAFPVNKNSLECFVHWFGLFRPAVTPLITDQQWYVCHLFFLNLLPSVLCFTRYITYRNILYVIYHQYCRVEPDPDPIFEIRVTRFYIAVLISSPPIMCSFHKINSLI